MIPKIKLDKTILLLCFFILLPVLSYGFQSEEGLKEKYISFIENKGQLKTLGDIKYYHFGRNAFIGFKDDGIAYYFLSMKGEAENKTVDISRTEMTLVNANSDVDILPFEEEKHYFNFYYAHCQQGILNVKSYKRLIYKNIYDGIDLVYYRTKSSNGFKYDFIVHPGADPQNIALAFNDHNSISLTELGEIKISNELGSLIEESPVVYSRSDKDNRILNEVEAEFKLKNGVVSFSIGNYDKSKTLVIDPNVNWSTYFGGFGADHVENIVIDDNNNIYLTGNTLSVNFPVSDDAYQRNLRGLFDAFVSKFDKDGNFLWSTYYGGDKPEYCPSIASDELGNVIISGWTWSDNFPVSEDCYQSVYGGRQNDGFIVKFNDNGWRLWATYLGGTNDEHIYSVATTSWNEIAVTGWTLSKNLLVSDNAFQTQLTGAEDSFIFMFDGDGDFRWGTYFGKDSTDVARGIDVDGSNNIIIGGFTRSLDLYTGSQEESPNNGKEDIFIAKFGRNGNFSFSKLIGGIENDLCYDIDIDGNNNILFCGNTISEDFPTTLPIQKVKYGRYDAVIGKLSSNGSSLWSTFYGGKENETAYGIHADKDNNVITVGRTYSSDFPVSDYPVQGELHGTDDAFAVKFNPSADEVFWSTFFGGSNQEWGNAATTDERASVYICGDSDSEDLMIVGNSYQPELSEFIDGFVAKLCATNPKPDIEPDGHIILCGDETVELDAGPGYEKYEWSTGDTTRKITVKFSGEYWVIVTDENLCSGISDIVTVYIAPLPEPEITGTFNICKGDTTVLDAGDFEEYWWSTGERTRRITVGRGGKYYVNVVDTNGCKGSDTAEVSILPSPEPEIIGPHSVCANSKGNIYETRDIEDHSYKWSISGGTINSGQNTATVSVSWGAPGTGYIEVRETNDNTSCKATIRLEVSIAESLEPVITSSTGNMNFCEGDSLELRGDVGYHKYEWSTGDTLRIITVKEPGEYIVRVEDNAGCEGFDTVNVIEYPNPDPEISGENEVCEFVEGLNYSIEALEGHTYAWNISGGAIISGTGTNSVTINWENPGQAYLEVNVSNDTTGCTGYDRLDVEIVAEPQPNIVSDPGLEICEGDSVVLSTEIQYAEYLWSDGTAESSVVVRKEGWVNINVKNETGCSGKDSVFVTVYPNPDKPEVREVGNDLVSSDAYAYQWYKDGEKIPGATNKTYTPQVTGYYSVVVFNEFGCSAASDPLEIWRGVAFSDVSFPDTVYAAAGGDVSIPLRMTNSENLDRVNADSYIAYIRFNRTVLLPTDDLSVVDVFDDQKVIRISGNRIGESGILSTIDFKAALGNAACSFITIDSLIWENAEVNVNTENGVFCLNDLCEADGTRLIMPTGNFALKQNVPNPFSKSTVIEYELIEKGHTSLEVFDAFGRKVAELVKDNQKAGKHSIIFLPKDLPNGIYFYILKTPDRVVSKKMFYIK